eukprot:TRINITY_DN106266_c0_g1_i1.p1 TRINITY_DN106266_c0_g1~~TRINITY_DN106266_c0_g1_i1.p1  ORF type:complete len:263 (+),score=-0.87 TRINITY_DN106266_c0_g1_i1:232-1020(+)
MLPKYLQDHLCLKLLELALVPRFFQCVTKNRSPQVQKKLRTFLKGSMRSNFITTKGIAQPSPCANLAVLSSKCSFFLCKRYNREKPVVDEESGVLPRYLKIMGVVLSLLLLVILYCFQLKQAVTGVYVAMSIMCAMDQKGLDVYFDQYPGQEFDLIQGLQSKVLDPTLTIRTDNWGYFRVAYLRVLYDANSEWAKYDCYLALCGVAGICGILWLLTSLTDAYIFCKEKWDFAIKGVLLTLAVLLIFIGGTSYVLNRICTHFV